MVLNTEGMTTNYSSEDVYELTQALREILPAEQLISGRDALIQYVNEHAQLDAKTFSTIANKELNQILSVQLTPNDTEMLTYLVANISDEYNSRLGHLINVDNLFSEPLLIDYLVTIIDAEQTLAVSEAITHYFEKKMSASEEIREPILRHDLIRIVNKNLTTQQSGQILISWATETDNLVLVQEHLTFLPDDLTEELKQLVPINQVASAQATLLKYVEQNKGIDSETFLTQVYSDFSDILGIKLSHADVDALLNYIAAFSEHYANTVYPLIISKEE